MSNLFEIAKDKPNPNQRHCLFCDVEYIADMRNVKRGWGLCCSKSCAALLRSKYSKLKGVDLIREKRNDALKKLGI